MNSINDYEMRQRFVSPLKVEKVIPPKKSEFIGEIGEPTIIDNLRVTMVKTYDHQVKIHFTQEDTNNFIIASCPPDRYVWKENQNGIKLACVVREHIMINDSNGSPTHEVTVINKLEVVYEDDIDYK